MAKDVRITFREGVTARFLKLRRLFVLSGQDEDGTEATVRVPISAIEGILDAAVEAKVEDAAMGASNVAATGMIVPQRISFMVTPAAGVSLLLEMSDGQEVRVFLPSEQPEPVLVDATNLIARGVALALQGHEQ